MTIVLYCLGLVFIVPTLLPLSRHEAWWIRACDFPRLQIGAGLLLVLFTGEKVPDTFFPGEKVPDTFSDTFS
ncbi:MAG: hypothetical protein ACREJS_10750 [Candidatus Rokuibacteriota bacterium]